MSKRRKPRRVRVESTKGRRNGNRKREAKRERCRDGCGGKKKYATPEQARDSAKRLMVARNLPRTAVYLCRKGPHYHVTSRPESGPWVLLLEVES